MFENKCPVHEGRNPHRKISIHLATNPPEEWVMEDSPCLCQGIFAKSARKKRSEQAAREHLRCRKDIDQHKRVALRHVQVDAAAKMVPHRGCTLKNV